jgi:ElaA protein
VTAQPILRSAPTRELDAGTLYGILHLRAAVFVVEQDCAYLDPDGRDLEPETRQLWATDGGIVVATARVLAEPDGGVRIGRVAVARSHRGTGLADRLMASAHSFAGPRSVVIDAQSGLVPWYGRHGYVVSGPEYVEDGIAHTPMRRDHDGPASGTWINRAVPGV